jgi:hypothetical protein
MRMMHPTLPVGQFADTDQETFDRVWEVRGWELAPDLGDTTTMTADEVIKAVGSDPVRAAVALSDETEGLARTKLMRQLTKLAASDEKKKES